MKVNFTIKRKACYFFIAIIIFSGILILYLSCKSKSPTEAASSLHKQVAVQSTNNTTTSSSTTTSVRPGNTPTNTTTLITSRTLTATSTSTTTTSIPTTSTSKPTTTIASANLKWCNFDVVGSLVPHYYPNCGDTFTTMLGECQFWINPQLRNIGQAPAQNVQVILKNVILSYDFEVWVIKDRAFLGTIPVGSSCTSGSPSIYILWIAGEPRSGDTIKLVFVETYSRSQCTFTIKIF